MDDVLWLELSLFLQKKTSSARVNNSAARCFEPVRKRVSSLILPENILASNETEPIRSDSSVDLSLNSSWGSMDKSIPGEMLYSSYMRSYTFLAIESSDSALPRMRTWLKN